MLRQFNGHRGLDGAEEAEHLVERLRSGMIWYLAVLIRYAVFRGRASRKEYWILVLVNPIIIFALVYIEARTGAFPGTDESVFATIYFLAVLIPSVAVAVRRLHDTGRSGWWLFIGLVPIVGAIILLVFLVEESDIGENQYGSSPWALKKWAPD